MPMPEPQAAPERWLPVGDAAQRTGFCEPTVRAAIAKGDLRVVRPVGLRARVMLASYARWQEQGAKAATQPTTTPAQPIAASARLSQRHGVPSAGCGILPA